jgi:hypothetical protein
LVTLAGGSNNRNRVAVVGPEGGEPREILEGGGATFAASGHIVYGTADGSLRAAPFDPRRLEVTGPSVPLVAGVDVRVGAAQQFGLSETGTLVYLGGGGEGGIRQLFTVDLEGNEAPLVLAPRPIGEVSWSPDGESVVYSSEGNIYTYNVVLNTTPRRLTFEGFNVGAIFSPDGTRVAFSTLGAQSNQTDLFVKNLNDDSPPVSLGALEGNEYVTQWPSDSLLVIERSRGTQRELWTLDLSDPDSPVVENYLTSERSLRSMVVSPDGTLAAYASNASGIREIYIRSFPEPGAPTIVSEGGGYVPFWSPDGASLYYSTTPTGAPYRVARLERNPVPVVVSNSPLFTGVPSLPPFPGAGLHPDGDRFILAGGVGGAIGDEGQRTRLVLVQNFFEELKRLAPN